jgi:cation diffusion facilitator family transporter
MELAEQKTNGLDRSGRVFAGRLTLAIGILLLIIKFFGYYLTNSTAILSDALESIVNVVTALTALFAIHMSSRPADETHPYGHGKVEFFSSGFEGLLIGIAGVIIIYKAIESLLLKPEVVQLTLGLILISVAGIVNGALGWYLIKKGKNTKSATLKGSGYHVLSDAYTSLGVIIGLFLVKLTGIWWLDPVTAGIIGFQITWHSYGLIKESIARLMDSADLETLNKIAKVLKEHRHPEWIAPHRLRAWFSGADLFIDLHLIMPYYWSLKDVHTAEHEIHDITQNAFKEPVEVIVHTEPCMPECCHMCSMKECPVRQHPQNKKYKWDIALLTGELSYQIKLEKHPEDPTI